MRGLASEVDHICLTTCYPVSWAAQSVSRAARAFMSQGATVPFMPFARGNANSRATVARGNSRVAWTARNAHVARQCATRAFTAAPCGGVRYAPLIKLETSRIELMRVLVEMARIGARRLGAIRDVGVAGACSHALAPRSGAATFGM